MTLPTWLTLLRILLIPLLITLYYLPMPYGHVVVTLLFALAAITDWFDGYLARRFNQISPFGAFLDPVADKLIVAVALVLLVGHYASPWLAVPAAIIIGREITISALREWMAQLGAQAHVTVSHIGKVKTTAQMTALLMLLYEQPLWGLPVVHLGYIALYIATLLTLLSMMMYLRAAWPLLLPTKKKTL